jgi:hypothetical protein
MRTAGEAQNMESGTAFPLSTLSTFQLPRQLVNLLARQHALQLPFSFLISNFSFFISLTLLLPNTRQMNNRLHTLLHILHAYIFMLAMKSHFTRKHVWAW